MNNLPPVQFKIQQVDQVCLFELIWHQGLRLSARLAYPDPVMSSYQIWHRNYLNFYKTMTTLTPTPLISSVDLPRDEALRGRLITSGTAPIRVDWQQQLAESEIRLLQAFHRWLRQEELDEIRAEIAHQTRLDRMIFLTCEPISLARLPWENWELESDRHTTGGIKLVRTPINIRTAIEPTIPTIDQSRRSRRHKPRILAVLGDDTGLNFQGDREAVKFLAPVADIQFVGWQPGQTALEVKAQILQAIADPDGWDVLFFAGHSNEHERLGGELAIAPNVTITIHDLEPHLITARQQGLQVAIFNSCKGLSIAHALINLGIRQVVVMREPIHNQVAQAFLVPLLQSLASHHDLYQAVVMAARSLRLERNLTYPSAYLIPSLVCHPGAELFHIPPTSWRHRWQQLRPTRWEAMVWAIGLGLSVIPAMQNILLDWRVATQAAYRDVTHQLPPVATPLIALVQIDADSVGQDQRLKDPNPINRSYLAELVTKLVQQQPTIIAIDYLLDRQMGDEAVLGRAIATAVERHGTWFVFGSLLEHEMDGKFAPASNIAQNTWSLQGHTEAFENRLMLPATGEDCQHTCPFAYVVATVDTAQQAIPTQIPNPQLAHSQDLRTALFTATEQAAQPNTLLTALQRSRLSPITDWLYQVFAVSWFHPIIDFSIPPDRVYDRIAAWRLQTSETFPHLPHQLVLIIPAGYPEAGYVQPGQTSDSYPLPLALRYWRDRLASTNNAASFPGQHSNSPDYLDQLPGGEIHAYAIHHLLTQRLVIPIPDLWLVCLAAALAKGMTGGAWGAADQKPWKLRRWLVLLVGTTTGYGVLSLQLYLSAAVLLPWLLPSLVLWGSMLPILWRKPDV